jgi:hypothetical protein
MFADSRTTVFRFTCRQPHFHVGHVLGDRDDVPQAIFSLMVTCDRRTSGSGRPSKRTPTPSSRPGRTWANCSTHEERLLILRHYVEVIELHSTDAKGGTYALGLFPDVRPDRMFDWSCDEPIGPQSPENMDPAAGDTAL